MKKYGKNRITVVALSALFALWMKNSFESAENADSARILFTLKKINYDTSENKLPTSKAN